MASKTFQQLTELTSVPLQTAIIPVSQGNTTYYVPVSLTREGVWLKPPDTAANNVINIRAAITAAVTSTIGRRVFCPAGTYNLNDTIYAQNVFGLTFEGEGQATVFNWTLNDNSKPVFKLYGRQCVFKNFRLTFEQPAYAGIQILRDNSGTHTVTPTNNRVENVFMAGGSKLVNGVVIGGTGNTDANNDFNVIEQCDINDYTNIGVSIGGTQSYGNRILNTRIIGDQINSQYAVSTGNAGGSFAMLGGATFGNLQAAFYLGRHYQPYRIQDVVSENDRKFIAAPSAAWRVLFVEGNRYSANMIDGTVIMDFDGWGKYFVRGNRLGDGQNPIAALTMSMSNLGSDGYFEFVGNDVFTTAANFVTGTDPDPFTGNSKITNEGSLTHEALVA